MISRRPRGDLPNLGEHRRNLTMTDTVPPGCPTTFDRSPPVKGPAWGAGITSPPPRLFSRLTNGGAGLGYGEDSQAACAGCGRKTCRAPCPCIQASPPMKGRDPGPPPSQGRSLLPAMAKETGERDGPVPNDQAVEFFFRPFVDEGPQNEGVSTRPAITDLLAAERSRTEPQDGQDLLVEGTAKVKHCAAPGCPSLTR